MFLSDMLLLVFMELLLCIHCISQHFASERCSFTSSKMFFRVVMVDFVLFAKL